VAGDARMQIRWRSLYVEDLMKRSKKQRGWPYREVGIIGEKEIVIDTRRLK